MTWNDILHMYLKNPFDVQEYWWARLTFMQYFVIESILCGLTLFLCGFLNTDEDDTLASMVAALFGGTIVICIGPLLGPMLAILLTFFLIFAAGHKSREIKEDYIQQREEREEINKKLALMDKDKVGSLSLEDDKGGAISEVTENPMRRSVQTRNRG